MNFVTVQNNHENWILKEELVEHKKILRRFKSLPKCIRKKIHKYHLSRMPMLLCPECGSGYYQYFLPVLKASVENCFMCEHNYYMLKFCSRPFAGQYES